MMIRKEDIKNWLKEKDNLILLGILLVAIIIRLYYFFATKNQVLWWDEAEYMLKAKSMALGTPDTGWWAGRPILFPIILSSFYFIGMGEGMIKIALLIVSAISVYLVYYVGMKLFDKKIALISAFLYSLVYLNLFYSVRVMVDVLSLTLALLAFSFYLSGKKRLIWWIIPALVTATLIRFPSFFMFVILIIYLFINEGTSFLKKKDYWISVGIGLIFAIPYLIWSQIKFGNPFYAVFYAGEGSVSGITLSSGLSVLMQYFKTFPYYFHPVLLIFLIIGLFMFYDLILGYDLIRKDNKIRNKAFVVIWILVILVYFGFAVSHFEDRYIFTAFPALFYIMSIGITSIAELLRKYHKYAYVSFVLFIVLIGGFQLIKTSDEIIKGRAGSFYGLNDAGLWIKEHTGSGDKIMIRSHPQNTYYSERESYSIPLDEKDFLGNLTEIKPKYIVVSVYDSPMDQNWWAYSINISQYSLTPVNAIPQDQPVLIIYRTNF